MGNPLQTAALRAESSLPYSIASKQLPMRVIAGNPSARSYASGKDEASVEAGNALSPISVENRNDWLNPDYTPQLLRHEMAHIVQNNWPQKIQNALPPVNPSDPYDYGGVAGLKKIGGDPMKLSVEQQAAIQQEMQAAKQRGEKLDPIYRTFDRKFGEVPLSVMQPTDPNQKGINTMARVPTLPADRVWGMGKLYAKDAIPVPKGSANQNGDDLAQYEVHTGTSTAEQNGDDLAQYEVPPDDAAAKGVPPVPAAPLPKAILGPAQPQPWLTRLDEDLRQGGNRTFIGRTLGHMQGNGDKGYSGLDSGVSPETANFMGSVPLGAVKMAQGVSEIPQHPVQGMAKTISGGLQAATIPLAFMGGPAAEGADTAIPRMAEKALDFLPVSTRAKAGRLFADVMSKAADQPVTISPQTMEPLERTQQLAMAGGKPFGTADKLYQRINTINPLNYREARDFAQNMALSPEEKLGLKKSMKYEVPRLSRAFNQDVGNAAAAAGKGSEYDRAMRMYRQASRNAAIGKGAFKYGGRVALGAAGAGGLYELGKAIKP